MNNTTQTISADNFCKICIDGHNTLIIDVRTPAEVRSQTIENAVNLPLNELTSAKFDSIVSSNATNADQSVFLLCGSGKRAHIAAEKLMSHSNNPLIIIEGGIQALSAAGLNTSAAQQQTLPLERQVRIAAGSLVLVGVILGSFIHAGLYGISAGVGVGLVYAGLSDNCGMALLLARMPWNK